MNTVRSFNRQVEASPLLSIVVPTYNERENVRIFIPKLADEFREVTYEIIVVDDDSPDGTAEEIRTLTKQHPQIRLLERRGKRGFGGALRAGYDLGKGEILVSVDADRSFSAKDLLRVYRAINEGYDLVIGSRHSPGSVYEALHWKSRVRRTASYWENALLRFFWSVPLHDFFSNCRAIRKTLWDRLETAEDSGFFLLEMVLTARAEGARIGEVPVAFADRTLGVTKINHIVEFPKTLGKILYFFLSQRFRR